MEIYDEMDEKSVNEPTTDKFNEAFSKYNMKVDAAWVKSVIEKAKKEAFGAHDKETLKKIYTRAGAVSFLSLFIPFLAA